MKKQHFTNIARLIALALLVAPVLTWATDCQEANRLYKRSLQKEALTQQGRLLIKAIGECPNHRYLDALIKLANLMKNKGELSNAQWLYRNAIQADPNFAPAYVGLGDVLTKRQDHQGAAAAFQQYRALQKKAGVQTKPDLERDVQTHNIISYPEIFAALIEDRKGGFGPPKIDIQIKFPINSDEVTKQTWWQCREMAKAIKEVFNTPGLENSQIRIDGHTDSRGRASYNKTLAVRRANSVKTVLVKDFNIPAASLKTEGWGEDKPIATNQSEEGRSMNRRVTLIRLGK